MNYHLFDLEIETVGDPASFNCSHKVGEGLMVHGENISFKPGTERFSHYALAALLPFIAAKQRATSKNDWMSYETDIACPDPIGIDLLISERYIGARPTDTPAWYAQRFDSPRNRGVLPGGS